MPKKTVKIIKESGNDYCIQVKGNQANLKKQMKLNIENNKPIDTYFKKEKNHGREENRLVEVYNNIEEIDEKWVGLERIIHVHRYGNRPNKKKNNGNYDEHSYYILSKAIDDAEIIFNGIRGHWGIENSLHYVKDVVMNEDKSRINKNSTIENLSIVKNMVINIFRLNEYYSLTDARIYFANKIKKMAKLVFDINIFNKNRTD